MRPTTTRPVKVAILGFGTVGRAVARVLSSGRYPELQLTCIFNRDIARKKVDWIRPDIRWTERFDDLLEEHVDVLAELVGGLSPPEDWVRRALVAGKSVVTANKQLVAHHGPELVDLARRAGCGLRFEASVAGGIPVLRALQEGLAGDRLSRIAGVLNGTCNYILSRMESDHLSFRQALVEARERGFAEADPTDDLDGLDARAKLAILASVGLDRRINPADIPTQSITPISERDFEWARRLGSSIRQVSWVELQDELVAWVSPAMVAVRSPIAAARDSQNVVIVRGEYGGETSFTGLGAGGEPTAVAVVSDLLHLARGGPAPYTYRLPSEAQTVSRRFAAARYLRFKTGGQAHPSRVMTSLQSLLSRHALELDRVLEEPGQATGATGVILLGRCPSSALENALDEARQHLLLREETLCLPVLCQS